MPAPASADPAPVYLVEDLHPGAATGGAIPTGVRGVVAGGAMFFRVGDPATGTELWRTDGTAEGTALVRDFWPGTNTSSPNAYDAGGALFVTASDGAHGAEPWTSDGTHDGTALLADIAPGPLSSIVSTQGVVEAGGTYFFGAYREQEGIELWASDGSEAGTRLVKDIAPGPDASSIPKLLTGSGSTLFFFAYDEAHGYELWKSDGSEAGTVLVADIRPGPESSASGSGNEYMRAFAGGVVFRVDDGVHGQELWRSDGTAQGTFLIEDIAPGSASGAPGLPPEELGGVLYFPASDPAYGNELWKSDGTAAGTGMLVDIEPGPASSSPGTPRRVGDRVLFFATTSIHGVALWGSDGTPAGTWAVHDLWPTNCIQSFGPQLMPAASLLYFTAPNCLGQLSLYRSNGTYSTYSVASLDSNSTLMGVIGDRLLYSDALGRLRKSDGTFASTGLVSDFGPHTSSSSPAGGIGLGGKLYFAASGPYGRGLWQSDGTAPGTVEIGNLPGQLPGAPSPQQLTPFDDTRFFFTAQNDATGRELWWSDGTTAGTSLVKDIYPGFIGALSDPPDSHPLTVAGGRIYFMAMTATSGRELWTSDGTDAGTQLVKDIRPGGASSDPRGIANLGGTLLFMANDGTHGQELWSSDGSDAGTQLVKDIRAGSSSSTTATVAFVELGGLLYFWANDGSGTQLWRTDGTAAGTQLFDAGGFGTQLTRIGDSLYYVRGGSLWTSDGTPAGTLEVPGTQGLSPVGLRGVGSRIAFSGDDGANGRELWTTDGTPAGIARIELWPGPGSSLDLTSSTTAGRFETVGDRLAFRANDGVHGEELWASDGTAAGTRRVADVAIPGGSAPSEITAVGDLVFFSALQLGPGRELFAVARAGLLDSDGDGLDDDTESQVHGTNPLLADSDADGLSDGAEVLVHGTDPLDPDSDDDGSTDGHEVNVLGTDPLDPGEGGSAPQVPGPGSFALAALAALLAAAGALALRPRRI